MEEEDDSPLPKWLEGDSLAPPCQAEADVVRAIVKFAQTSSSDVLFDLGCGDGRICIEAAESCGARAVGVEIEPDLVVAFRRRVAARGLGGRVTVIEGDLRDIDLAAATVVCLYLLPEAVAGLRDRLVEKLRRDSACRVVCNTFGLAGLVPAETAAVGLVELRLYDRRSLVDAAPGDRGV